MLFNTRSTKGITRLSLKERTLITIPENIKDILVGLLLGDGLVRIFGFLVLFLVPYLLLYININIDNIALALNSSFTLTLIPILVYSDPKLDKASILTENKGKSGIYL